MKLWRRLIMLGCLLTGLAHASPAPFDLSGPSLEFKVTRDGHSLPASEVPNLAEGDRLWLRANLPSFQSAHYLMVAAFLTGSTNPPPKNWFFQCETWKGRCATEGLTISVPPGAQQVMVFFAPSTSGDFSTLVDAVRGKPGAFVRASQDLNQAALDRSRLDRYLDAVRDLNRYDPSTLKDVTPLLARSLAIKVDDKCLERAPELQAPCLMQGQESLILNDGHSSSLVGALTASSESDLLMSVSSTAQAGYGIYSPYIASVIDIAHILDSFSSAQYQYIPALNSLRGDLIKTTLNAAPSFHDPKSVIVIALPAVEQAQLPPLHAVDPKEIYCASRTSLVLPVEGAPLAYSTSFAHDITLDLSSSDGKSVELPAIADAQQGGYVVDTSSLNDTTPSDSVQGELRGYWGFDPYRGPSFRLRNAHPKTWTLAGNDADSLIVGRTGTVHLQADSVSCVDGIMLRDPAGKELKADWKAVSANEVEVSVPLQSAQPGQMTLLVRQFGMAQAQQIPIQAFADAGRFDSFVVHSGDTQGVLRGGRLDEVASLAIGNLVFKPGDIASANGRDELTMNTQDSAGAAALNPDPAVPAKVTLKDGRILNLSATVGEARPKVGLIGKSVQPSQSSGASNIELANQDELPQDSVLTFSVRAQRPATFARDQVIEVATNDQSFTTSLSVANGGLRLADSRVVVATLDPTKAFGASAFGPLQFRTVTAGATGDWQPLATLVRLPVLKDIKCPAAADQSCKLSGSDLFLVDSVSDTVQFDHPVQVPDGFPGYALPVPRPADGRLYMKLRDDPSVINRVALKADLPPAEPPHAEAPATAAPPEATAPAPVPAATPAATPTATPVEAAKPAAPAGDKPATPQSSAAVN